MSPGALGSLTGSLTKKAIDAKIFQPKSDEEELTTPCSNNNHLEAAATCVSCVNHSLAHFVGATASLFAGAVC